MSFWIIISVLLVVSVLLLLWILNRRLPGNVDLHHQRILRNVNLYKQHHARLDEDLQQGEMTQEIHTVVSNDLSRNLLSDVNRLETAPRESRVQKKWLWILLPAPLLALAIYAATGAYADWQITQQLENLGASTSAEEYQHNLEGMHISLERRLQQRPDNIEYRLLLANYAMGQKNYDQASAHYRVLLELLPEDADILGYYAQAEYLREGRKMTPLVSNAIDKALDINPMQKTVLGLKGIAAFEKGDLQEGIKAWEKLLLALGDDNQSAAMIRDGIDKAKAELAEKGLAAPEPATSEESGITVMVTLGEQLPAMDPQLTVFVYAKAASGPPMPLAVKRMQLKDLPAEVRLDDSMAMMAQMKLSQFDEVVIGARISFSGQPVAQKGDWQGETAAIRWKEAGMAEVGITEQVE